MTEKKGRSPLLIIFFTVFIDLVGFGIVLPLSPYYAEHFGASAFAVGMLQACYSLMQFIFAPIWGRLSDKVGRRPIILMSIFGGCISYYVFAAADALWVLFAARIFQGIFAANLSATQAYVADVTTEKNRSKGMGMIGAAFGLGFVFGPAIGAKLSTMGAAVGAMFGHEPMGVFGMGFPALVASLMCLCNFTFALFKLPESLTAENRAGARSAREGRVSLFFKAMNRPQVAWLIFVFFLTSFSMGNMESTLALFTEKRMGYGIRETGELFAFVGVLMAFTQGYLIRKLIPKLGERKMIVLGPLLSGIGLAATALTHTTWGIAFTMGVLAVGSGISNPAILGGISLVTDPKEQGGIMGVNSSLGSLARFLGPACGGFLFGQFSPPVPYYFAGLVMLIVMFISMKNAEKIPDVARIEGMVH